MKAKFLAPWVAVAVLGLLAAVALWYEPLSAPSAQPPATVVAVQFPIASPETARLAEVPVKLGDAVQPGQLLARIDTLFLEQERAIAEARLREILSGIGSVSTTLESSDFDARSAILRDSISLNAELDALKQSQRGAAAERNIVQNELSRQRRLVAEGLATAIRAEELSQRLQMLDVDLKLAQERIQAKQRQIKAAEERASSWQAQYSLANSRILNSRTRPLLESAEVQRRTIAALEERIAAARILSPAAGVVAVQTGFSGSAVRAGEPFLFLQSSGPHQIVAYADQRVSSRFHAGLRVSVARLSEPRKTFASKVSRVGAQVTLFPERFWAVSTTPQYGFEIYIDMPAGAGFSPGEALVVKTLPGDSK